MSEAFEKERYDPEALASVERIDLIAHILGSAMIQGFHRSRRKGFSSEFADYKPYMPGDDLRHLDWQLYARSDKLYVKRLEAETNIEVTLMLDATRSMAWRWQRTINKLEYSANLMAALAFLYTRQHDPVGLLVHDAHDLHYLPPRSRRVQLDHIFATLSKVRPGSANAFPLLLRNLAGRRRHRGHIFIFSDLEEDENEIEKALEQLSGQGDEIVVIQVLDKAEIELPFQQVTHIRDSESGAVIEVNMNQLRAMHEERVRLFRGHWEQRCARWDLIFVPLDTGINYLDALMTLAEAWK